ncbi:unnamed protein product [Closterium sp. NIES-54]
MAVHIAREVRHLNLSTDMAVHIAREVRHLNLSTDMAVHITREVRHLNLSTDMAVHITREVRHLNLSTDMVMLGEAAGADDGQHLHQRPRRFPASPAVPTTSAGHVVAPATALPCRPVGPLQPSALAAVSAVRVGGGAGPCPFDRAASMGGATATLLSEADVAAMAMGMGTAG